MASLEGDAGLPGTGDRSSGAFPAHEPACFPLARDAKFVVTRGRDVRLVQDEDGLVVESRHGGTWGYEFRADSLDHAIERAARHEVEQRFRAGHSRIALDGEHTLLYGRKGWTVERHHRLLGTSRGRAWGTIYAALLRPVRGGIKGDVGWLRRAVFELHQEAVGKLRAGLGWLDPYIESAPCDPELGCWEAGLRAAARTAGGQSP